MHWEMFADGGYLRMLCSQSSSHMPRAVIVKQKVPDEDRLGIQVLLRMECVEKCLERAFLSYNHGEQALTLAIYLTLK